MIIKNNFTAILVSLTLLIYSCETNPPNLPDLNQEMGKVYVTSGTVGAEIFIDDIFTGKYTPDTIETTLGEHNIKVF